LECLSKPCALLEEEVHNKRNVINNVINTSKERIIKTFSITRNDFELLNDFIKVSLTESGHRGLSETILKAMREYVQRHALGNSQIKISNYCLNEPTPSAHFCNHSKGNMNDGQVFCINPSMIKRYEAISLYGANGLWVSGITCYSCNFNKLRRNQK
jgi:hypothetical protein